MFSRTGKLALVWGGFFILAGVLLLVDTVIDVSVWIWVILLLATGLVALGFYWTDRTDWAMLIPAYVLLAIALLLILIELDILRDDAVAVYVLAAIAVAFLVVYFRNRAQWWPLIPAYVMLVVAGMIGLLALGVLNDLLVPAYVLLAIAIPFFVVYALNRRNWWALIPGGILALIGLGFLVAEAAIVWIAPVVLLGLGIYLLARVILRREPAGGDAPPGPGAPPAGEGPDEPPAV